MFGHHLLKSWSATQRNITLSSAEAELVAAVRTCSECIGVVQLASDWGVNVSANNFVDSSAAMGVVHRREWQAASCQSGVSLDSGNGGRR